MFLHPLPKNEGMTAPEQFTFPFHYTPHPMCEIAAKEVRKYLESQPTLMADAKNGKMFGVLVVEKEEEYYFLAAYSALLAGSNKWPWFVPAIYDLQEPGSYFPEEEKNIEGITARIAETQNDPEYAKARERLKEIEDAAKESIEAQKLIMASSKMERDMQRTMGVPEEQLVRESQKQKADLKRLKKQFEEEISSAQVHIKAFATRIETLKTERATRSQALQRWLFDQYRVLDANGAAVALPTLFKDLPPSGSGECCAPKLLQCAYQNHWKPICMAEFWIGASPKEELRIDGHYYPACRSKCRPILAHMLQGLEVEANPVLERNRQMVKDLEVIYSDEDIVVINKPSGMLSVPGNEEVPSVKDEIQRLFPKATGPLIVHRLDMDTSGLMVLALHFTAYKNLQKQFEVHSIQKRYVALVEKELAGSGEIHLPLCANPNDRPRQMVSEEYGKEAHTHYEVVESSSPSRLNLWPLTGRTHQLRVHCAHHEGLNTPIVGDTLYGTPAERLMLHAEELTFAHPRNGRKLTFCAKAPF